MENKKIWLGMMVMTLVLGMTVVGCKTDNNNPNNPFDGTSWTMDKDRSVLKFYSSTWEWFGHIYGKRKW